jgi:chromosome segregation ATPase
MASLNKRSKDNYGDLMSLKDATTSRDEDIRKSLRDLVAGLETKFTTLDARLLSGPEANRSAANMGLYIDDKAHNATPRKSFGLPRIGSPTSFSVALDRELSASPSLACVDGAASIALLEKVLREMATRDGQDKIMSTLEAVKSHASARSQSVIPAQPAIDPAMMTKLEDILMFMKDMRAESGSRALVRSSGTEPGKPPSNLDVFLEEGSRGGSPGKSKHASETRASMAGSEYVTDEVVKMLKNVKQSLAQGGGLTNEVKVLVRELRGEVLGMGRELGRKLEEVQTSSKAVAPNTQSAVQDELAMIVQQGLAELKEHMHHIVQESRRRSLEVGRPADNTQEIIQAVHGMLAELPQPRQEPVRDPGAEREELLAAIREAWEDCKPEIALEHFGLERDEILETLKEGLKSHQPQQPTARDAGATYEDVLLAVTKGLADFQPPEMPPSAGLTQEDVFRVVQQCLETFEWPAQSTRQGEESGLTRDDVAIAVREELAQHTPLSRDHVVEAVRNGLSNQEHVTKEIEFNREDLFDAIKACLEGEQNPLGGMGERVIEAMHEFLGSMKTEFQQYSAASGKDTEQVLDALKDGLEDLRADIESYVDRAADVTGKDEIIDTVKAGFAAMQADIDKGFAGHGTAAPNTPELLDAMEKEFEHLRDTISKSMARSSPLSERDEILDAIRDISDDRQSALSSNSEDIVRLVKEELEHMRTTLAGTLIKSGSSLERDEVLDAIREGLEASRSGPPMPGNESILSNTSELLDAFQDGVDGIRADIQKLTDHPVDLSTSYDILDTLKTGIEQVRADISDLKDKQNEGPDPSSERGQEIVLHDSNRIATEIEGLKVMITQLRIKIEALDGMAPPPVVPSELRMHKDDMNELYDAIQQVGESVGRSKAEETHLQKDDLDGLFTAINEVSHAVNEVRDAPAREATVMPDNAATKEDTDAIETLLRNVRARLDDVLPSDSEDLAKAAQIDAIEFTLKDIKLAVDEIAVNAGEQSSKEDFTLIELMLKDVQSSVDDFATKLAGISDDQEHLDKTDLQVVETLCMDIKSQIEGIQLPGIEGLSSKEDILDMKNDLKAFREQFEADNGLTAQAFEARKIEHGGLATKIDDVKSVIGDLRDELIGKVEGSADGIVELNKVLGMHHDDMTKYATASSVAELSDMIKGELDRHMDHHASSKTEMEERDATLFAKHDETGADIKSAIEDKFNELMTKYDDAQLASDAKLNALEERDTAHLEATSGTKAVVDDLKSLMDALGSTVTDTCERVSEDSKTVFGCIEDSNSKLDNLHSANAFEHGVTRDEIAKVLAAASRFEGTLTEHHPAVLAAIGEVLGVVRQHYEHSQQQTESFARATEEIKSGVDSIPAAIPPLLPALPAAPASPTIVQEAPVQSVEVDGELNDKLDTLLSHASLAKEVFAGIENHQKDTRDALGNLGNMSKLDEIHAQVMATAAEIASMVTTQARLMGEHHDSKVAEATEAAIALEKRTAQKEKVEADIVALNQEKNALVESMAELRKEQQEISSQTRKLTRDVAKLETALQIRQDEMREMNARAESLERRIIEGLVNQARSVKPPRPVAKSRLTPAERDASMSLKRVPSNASTMTAQTSIKSSNSAMGSAVGMALKKRTPLGSNIKAASTPRTSAIDRRILSTSHVTGNRGRNTPDMALVLAPVPKTTGLASLKRSQSVKSNPSSYLNGRKASWNGVASDFTDKENLTIDHDHDDSDDDAGSDASTERRTSVGTSLMYSDSMTYGTGSSLSGHSRRSTSCASSVIGTVNGQTDSIAEEDEEPEVTEESQTTMVLHDAPVDVGQLSAGQDNSMALTTFDDGLETPSVVADAMSDLQPPPVITEKGLKYHGSDSGLGTEPLTAGTEEHLGEAQEYFRMTAQDMQT